MDRASFEVVVLVQGDEEAFCLEPLLAVTRPLRVHRCFSLSSQSIGGIYLHSISRRSFSRDAVPVPSHLARLRSSSGVAQMTKLRIVCQHASGLPSLRLSPHLDS